MLRPLEITAGQLAIEQTSEEGNGRQGLAIKLSNVLHVAELAFTIKVGDTLPQEKSELGLIRVSAAEIAGVYFDEHSNGAGSAAAFCENAKARLDCIPCAETPVFAQ